MKYDISAMIELHGKLRLFLHSVQGQKEVYSYYKERDLVPPLEIYETVVMASYHRTPLIQILHVDADRNSDLFPYLRQRTAVADLRLLPEFLAGLTAEYNHLMVITDFHRDFHHTKMKEFFDIAIGRNDYDQAELIAKTLPEGTIRQEMMDYLYPKSPN